MYVCCKLQVGHDGIYVLQDLLLAALRGRGAQTPICTEGADDPQAVLGQANAHLRPGWHPAALEEGTSGWPLWEVKWAAASNPLMGWQH